MSCGKVEICGVDTSTLPVLTNERMRELFPLVHGGDKAAREEFIRGNLRLVLSVIQRFSGRGENVDDLFQVGCIGLIKALDNFDVSQNVRFSTYAGRILWEQGKHEDARAAWDAMCRRHPDDWLAHACAADCLAHAGCFSEAAELYRESLRLQEKPRYTDSAICIAQICELQGAYAEAIEAWNDVMQILKEEHGVSDGECLDAPAREIERLSALCRENSGIPQKEILP